MFLSSDDNDSFLLIQLIGTKVVDWENRQHINGKLYVKNKNFNQLLSFITFISFSHLILISYLTECSFLTISLARCVSVVVSLLVFLVCHRYLVCHYSMIQDGKTKLLMQISFLMIYFLILPPENDRFRLSLNESHKNAIISD